MANRNRKIYLEDGECITVCRGGQQITIGDHSLEAQTPQRSQSSRFNTSTPKSGRRNLMTDSHGYGTGDSEGSDDHSLTVFLNELPTSRPRSSGTAQKRTNQEKSQSKGSNQRVVSTFFPVKNRYTPASNQNRSKSQRRSEGGNKSFTTAHESSFIIPSFCEESGQLMMPANTTVAGPANLSGTIIPTIIINDSLMSTRQPGAAVYRPTLPRLFSEDGNISKEVNDYLDEVNSDDEHELSRQPAAEPTNQRQVQTEAVQELHLK